MLIFSHVSERDGAALLESLANTLQSREIKIACVVITTYDHRVDGVDDIGEFSLGMLHRCTSLICD